MIRTKRIDITNYITYLQSQEKQAMSEGLKKQLNIYTKFVKNLIVQNDVLDKTFFIVIPYHTGTIITKYNVDKRWKKSKEEEEKNQNIQTDQLIEKAKIFLPQKRSYS